MNTPIGDKWTDYRDSVVPNKAGPAQVRDTEHAFYAGALVVFNLVCDLGDLPDDEVVSCITDIRNELSAYAESIRFKLRGRTPQ